MPIASVNVETGPLDPRRFRAVIGAFATGIAVITTEANGEYHGMTVNSLTSVSLDPCMLLICLRLGSTTGQAIRKRGEFTVNILADHQRELLHRFVNTRVADRFADLDVEFSPGGMPLLPGAIAISAAAWQPSIPAATTISSSARCSPAAIGTVIPWYSTRGPSEPSRPTPDYQISSKSQP
jgi:3-hydroxy-9,10-secoandrosta-1,3,5(10)-triene-9,17-dione monooxygenase reductase component